MEYLKTSMPKKMKRPLQQNRETNTSNWLIMLPFADYGVALSKQHIWDSINLRYDWVTSNLTTTCPCGKRLEVIYSIV